VPTLASAYWVKLVADGVLRRSLMAVCMAAVLIAVARELAWLPGGLDRQSRRAEVLCRKGCPGPRAAGRPSGESRGEVRHTMAGVKAIVLQRKEVEAKANV
jgi:hypothetical protein